MVKRALLSTHSEKQETSSKKNGDEYESGLRSQYTRKEHCQEALEIQEICSYHLLLRKNVVQEVKAKNKNRLTDVILPPAQLTRSGFYILIGADYYWTFVTGEVQKLQGALVAVKTDFGWTLQGTVPHSGSITSCYTVAVLRANVGESKCSLTTEHRMFWELEIIAITGPNLPQKEEDKKLLVRLHHPSSSLTDDVR